MSGGFRFWLLAEHWTGQTTEVYVGCNGGDTPVPTRASWPMNGSKSKAVSYRVQSFLQYVAFS